MNRRIEQTVANFSMLQAGDRVVVGVSGGADSMALLYFLKEHAALYGISLIVCHLNHLLRGKEAEEDEAFVRQICKQWQLPCEIKRVPVGKYAQEREISIETCGREERYRFFQEIAAAASASKIATAHTLSDSAETVLYHLARGTALPGLCGIPPMRGKIIRPLIGVTRQEIEAYCRQHKILYRTDSSNADPTFKRNYIRQELVGRFVQINPSFFSAIERMCRINRVENDYLSVEADKLYRSSLRKDGLSLLPVREAHLALQRRVLCLFLQGEGLPCDERSVDVLQKLITGKIRAADFSKGHRYLVRNSCLVAAEYQPKGEKESPVAFGAGKFQRARGKSLIIEKQPFDRWRNYEEFKNFDKNGLKNLMDCAKLKTNVVIRCRQPGDSMLVAGRRGTKSLKKLFNEYKIPPEEREYLWIIADEEGVLWVEEIGVAQRAAPDENTHWVWRIDSVKDQGEDQ